MDVHWSGRREDLERRGLVGELVDEQPVRLDAGDVAPLEMGGTGDENLACTACGGDAFLEAHYRDVQDECCSWAIWFCTRCGLGRVRDFRPLSIEPDPRTPEDRRVVLRQLALVRAARRHVEHNARALVRRARKQGLSWQDIGQALGVTRQAAFLRYREETFAADPLSSDQDPPRPSSEAASGQEDEVSTPAYLDASGVPLSCSFCGRSGPEAARLVAGPAAVICSDCVHSYQEIFNEEQGPTT